MAITSRAFAWLALLAGVALTVPSARAAESYDNCTGFIDAVPATISTQGTWCLRHDVSTAIYIGNAIHIATNNVTLDCNGFKVGGLAAGSGTIARGIYASSYRTNVTVRNCNVRGFATGIYLWGFNHVVENNRLDGNTVNGIVVDGEHNRVQHNAVYDTGNPNSAGHGVIQAIRADEGDVLDNVVAGVTGVNTPVGIYVSGTGSVVARNRVRGLVAGNGNARGISLNSAGITVDRNHVAQATTINGGGIIDFYNASFCSRNTVAHYSPAFSGCDTTLDNLELPPP